MQLLLKLDCGRRTDGKRWLQAFVRELVGMMRQLLQVLRQDLQMLWTRSHTHTSPAHVRLVLQQSTSNSKVEPIDYVRAGGLLRECADGGRADRPVRRAAGVPWGRRGLRFKKKSDVGVELFRANCVQKAWINVERIKPLQDLKSLKQNKTKIILLGGRRNAPQRLTSSHHLHHPR